MGGLVAILAVLAILAFFARRLSNTSSDEEKESELNPFYDQAVDEIYESGHNAAPCMS